MGGFKGVSTPVWARDGGGGGRGLHWQLRVSTPVWLRGGRGVLGAALAVNGQLSSMGPGWEEGGQGGCTGS